MIRLVELFTRYDCFLKKTSKQHLQLSLLHKVDLKPESAARLSDLFSDPRWKEIKLNLPRELYGQESTNRYATFDSTFEIDKLKTNEKITLGTSVTIWAQKCLQREQFTTFLNLTL